jgi:hypothetical protein
MFKAGLGIIRPRGTQRHAVLKMDITDCGNSDYLRICYSHSLSASEMLYDASIIEHQSPRNLSQSFHQIMYQNPHSFLTLHRCLISSVISYPNTNQGRKFEKFDRKPQLETNPRIQQ